MGGTSQATPYITGMATLAQQIAQLYLGRELTVTEFNALLDTTSHLINDGDNEDDNVVNTGLDYPRINVLALAEAIITLDGDLSSDLDFGNPILNQLLLTINDNPSANPLQTYGDASVFKGNSLPQDKPEATVTYLDNGNEVNIKNNAWKGWTPFADGSYTVTPNTVLTFDYMSTEEGEIQGIGFDNNDNFFDNTQYLFQLFGTQTFGDTVQDFNTYNLGDGWKSYSLNIGQYFTGTFDRIFFVNDNDTPNNLGSNSSFRNLVLEEIPPTAQELTMTIKGNPEANPLQTYGDASVFNGNSLPQDRAEAVVTYLDNGNEVQLENNAWKAWTPFADGSYTLTPNTVLTFDYRSTEEGEIQGIGFDNNDNFFDNTQYLFQLFGTQTFGDTVQDFNNYQISDGWKSYSINVGEYFTGTFERVFLANDNDTSDNLGSNSSFRNIVLFENPTSPITDQLTVRVDGTTINDTLERYGEASVFNGNSLPQDTNEAVVTYSDNGNEVQLQNNSWKSLDITGYTVTENTRLSFQFRSSEEAEIQGLGLDNDDDLFNDRNTIFQLYGTQTFANQAFNDYQGLNDPQATDGWKDYNISLGQYFTGEYDRLVFVNDNDTADNLGGEAQFRNIVLSEVSQF